MLEACAAALVCALAAPAPSGAVEFRAVADTGVDASRPHRTAGSARVLRLSRSPLRRGFVRFDLRGQAGPLSKATLRVFGRGRLTVRPLATGSRWSERHTTFSRAPRVAGPRVRSPRLRGRWGRVDVTRLVSPGERVELALGGAPRARIRSRESSRPPILVVTTRSPAFTPAPTPSPTPAAPPVTPSPEPAAATLTIVQDTQPDGGQTFTYAVGTATVTLSGDSRRTLVVDAGRRSISQREAIGWPLMELGCTGARGTTVDRMRRAAEFVVGPGDSVDCTFRNQRHDPVIAAAGDIACKSGNSCGHRRTSDLLIDRPELTRVLPLGDVQYETGLLEEFMAPGAYHDTWGRVRQITRPAVGNHEYETPGAAGYFDYFNGIGQTSGPAGDRATGYYSFDLGAWHLVALNSNLSADAGSAQEAWLRADLAAHPAACTLAYWHHPRWTSGSVHSPAVSTQALWRALYEAGADVVLGAHNHQYERFARQDADGAVDGLRGIRQFVVGTGGAGLYTFGAPLPNSQVRYDGGWGVLTLTLRSRSYDWRFEPAGGSFTDEGSTACAEAPPRYAFRGLFSREEDGGFARIARLGFNLIDSVPGTIADLPPDLRALVWVGNYDDATCSFEMSDAELRARVEQHAADPRAARVVHQRRAEPIRLPRRLRPARRADAADQEPRSRRQGAHRRRRQQRGRHARADPALARGRRSHRHQSVHLLAGTAVPVRMDRSRRPGGRRRRARLLGRRCRPSGSPTARASRCARRHRAAGGRGCRPRSRSMSSSSTGGPAG